MLFALSMLQNYFRTFVIKTGNTKITYHFNGNSSLTRFITHIQLILTTTWNKINFVNTKNKLISTWHPLKIRNLTMKSKKNQFNQFKKLHHSQPRHHPWLIMGRYYMIIYFYKSWNCFFKFLISQNYFFFKLRYPLKCNVCIAINWWWPKPKNLQMKKDGSTAFYLGSAGNILISFG